MKRPSVQAAILAIVVAAAAGQVRAESAADLFSGFQAKSSDPVQVNAESLEVYEQGKQRVSVFSGNVVVTRGDTRLEAATITLYSEAGASRVDAFNRIEAGGGVFVRSKDQTVTGKTAVVNMDTNTITVSGNVVLSQGGNVLTGSQLVVNLTTGRARLEGGQVRGLFTPSSPPKVGQ